MHIDRRAERLLAEHVSEGPDDELLTVEQMADWYGCSTQWFEIARTRGTGPKFVTLSNRQVRYRREAGRDFLRKREKMRTTGSRREQMTAIAAKARSKAEAT
jgi:hypothetical protein